MQRFENYELQRELGRGATAKIYLAKHDVTNDLVSLKIFHPKLFQDPHFSARINREIQVSTGLRHRNIVKVREVLRHTDPPALVMDYVEGENLEKFQGRLPYILPEVSVLIAIEILKALEYSHGEGLIHRDLKPENVLIRTDGRVFVTDFGLAKMQEMSMITQANVIVGSIDYMSPEQARGENLTPQSDLFSLATILYYLTTGTRAFSRATTVSTLNAIREETPELPQKRNPKLSIELSRLIQKGLEKNLDNRFKNATEFRQALQAYLASIGLDNEDFALTKWAADSSQYLPEALRTAAEKLTEICKVALKQKKWDTFLQSLSHLGLKSSDSAALPYLTMEYRKAKQGPWRRWAAIAAIVIIVVGTSGFFMYDWFRSQMNTMPVAQTLASPHVLPEPSGRVKFNVASDISVFWDGVRVIDPTKPLNGQKLGEHQLTLARPGFPPMTKTVIVTLEEPAVVNVK